MSAPTGSILSHTITLSDGSVHEVEAADLKAAQTKLLKRKAIKDAGLTVVEAPAENKNPPATEAGAESEEVVDAVPESSTNDDASAETPADATPAPTAAQVKANIVADLIVELPAIIAAYFAEHASNDPTAPNVGAPFMQNERYYLQLEGRGGAGKGVTEFTPTGLRPFMLTTQGDATPGKGAIRSAMIALGFERKPFSYNHAERGSSSSSYYSAPIANIGSVTPVEARKTAPRSKRANVNPSHTVSDDPIIPQRPEGSPEDVAGLDARAVAYLDAQNALKAQTAEWGRNPIKKDASKAVKDAAKAERDKLKEELTAAMREAHEELVGWRRMMHTKNIEAATPEADSETTAEPADAAA